MDSGGFQAAFVRSLQIPGDTIKPHREWSQVAEALESRPAKEEDSGMDPMNYRVFVDASIIL